MRTSWTGVEMQEVRFPDGTVVRAAGVADRERDADWREIGLYLDARWAPSWPAEIVDWPDFGVPMNDAAAVTAIRRAFDHARSGRKVEVGCVGGVGRTGTVLACMAVLAGVPTAEAVAWVRSEYASTAVETSAQEAWVHVFAEHIRGER